MWGVELVLVRVRVLDLPPWHVLHDLGLSVVVRQRSSEHVSVLLRLQQRQDVDSRPELLSRELHLFSVALDNLVEPVRRHCDEKTEPDRWSEPSRREVSLPLELLVALRRGKVLVVGHRVCVCVCVC